MVAVLGIIRASDCHRIAVDKGSGEENPIETTQLMYLSSAVEPFTDAMLDALLDNARRKNAELDVTGLLLYVDGSFLQVLEGPGAAVDAVYTAILKDDRHRNVLEVFNNETAERSFPDWSMAFVPSDLPRDDGRQAFLRLRRDVLADAGYIKGPQIISHIVATFVHRLPAMLDT